MRSLFFMAIIHLFTCQLIAQDNKSGEIDWEEVKIVHASEELNGLVKGEELTSTAPMPWNSVKNNVKNKAIEALKKNAASKGYQFVQVLDVSTMRTGLSSNKSKRTVTCNIVGMGYTTKDQ